MNGKLLIYCLSIIVFFFSNASAQEISPRLVGNNAWYTNPSQQVWDLTAECGVQTIRIGGNAYNDNMPSNTVLLGWVKKIQAMGAEPIIQVSQFQSAAEAAGVVHYFNVEKSGEIPPVMYWNIGNEPWLKLNRPATSTIGASVEAYFKPLAAAMKEVDSTIQIYGPDFCYYIEDAINDLFGGKNDIAGKVPGKDYYYCDGISWHLYPQNESNLAYGGLESFRRSIVKCKQKVDAVNASHNRTGEDALQWGIGEFNAEGGEMVHTWGNGQMFGGILGYCMEYEATYATSWSMFENGGSRSGSDFSFIDGANMTPRASYRHMEFVAKHFQGNYLEGQTNSNDFVVYGARGGEQVTVMLMHRGSGSPKEYTLHLNDTASAGGTYVLNVSGEMERQYSDIIAPLATQVLIFNADTVTKISYNSEDFDRELPPVYASFEMADTLPETPSDLQAYADSHHSIQLGWVDHSDNEQGFIIERETASVFEVIAVLSPDLTSYTDTDLMPETLYSYRIRAYNSMGKSEYSGISSATTLETPAAIAFNGPHSIPGTIEAEDFNDNGAGISFYDSDAVNEGGAYRSTGVDIEACTEGGFNVGYIENGEWLSFLIENVSPGLYDMNFRTASSTTSTKRIDVFLDDKNVGNVKPTNTGGWQNWETLTLESVEIENTEPINMRLEFVGQEYNVNWVEFAEHINTSNTGISYASDFQIVHDQLAHTITLTLPGTMGENVVDILNLSGQTMYKTVCQGADHMVISTSQWDAGIYLVTVTNQHERLTRKLIL